MPPPPDILLEMAEQDQNLRFDPVYMGPLAQAQRERFSKEGLRKFFAEIGPLVELYPQVMDNFDLDQAGRILAETTNIPSDVLKPQEEVEEFRAQKARQMAAEQQKQDLERLASGMKDAAAIDKDGNITESIMEAAGGPPT